MRIFFLVLACLMTAANVAQAQENTPESSQTTGAEIGEAITGGINQVQGFVQGGAEAVQPINDAITGVGDFLGTNQPPGKSFDPNTVFPAWGNGGEVRGVIGSNNGALNRGESRLLIYFIPKVIEILIWIVAPLTTVMFLFSGVQFIYGGDREEEVKQARMFFRYAVIGLMFIVLSYSFMKAVFFILV